jgi:beta-1,2-mannobiose phosphorylase / 1,2-beta-oligomannan phosphorylase
MISAELFAGALDVTCRRMGIVMEPDGTANELEGVLNPGVTRDRRGHLLLFPRSVTAGNVSRIGIARLNAAARAERIGIALEAQEPYELRNAPGGHGCEDPRVTFIADIGKYVMTYTAYGPAGARIAIAVSDDAYAWTRLGLVRFHDEQLNAVDNKDAAFFPGPVWSPAGVPSLAFFHRPMCAETINGQTPIAVILALPAGQREATCIAYVPLANVKRDPRSLCAPTESIRVLEVGDTWGRLKNGAGTPPIRTSLGWLSVFHGVDAIDKPSGKSLYYSAGIMINDLHSPDRLVYRSAQAVLVPETTAERFGTVNDVVFPTGIDEVARNAFDVYYGAADAKISRARFEFANV